MYTSNSSAVHHSKVWNSLHHCMDLHSLLYIKIGRVAVFCTYTAQSKSKYLKQTPAKWAITTNTTFTTQTVLCKAPYCQSLCALLHPCTRRKKLTFCICHAQWSKKHVSHFIPLPLPDLKYVHG